MTIKPMESPRSPELNDRKATPWLYQDIEYEDLLARRNKKTSRGWRDPPLAIERVSLVDLKLNNNNVKLLHKLQSLRQESYYDSYRRL